MLAVGFIQYYFFRVERQRLIDQQIEGLASSLYSSELTTSQLDDLDEAEEVISDALGDDKITALITVYDTYGNILYRNRNAEFLNVPITPKAHWQTWKVGDHNVRLLNFRPGNSRLIMQVGLLLDTGQVRWRTLNVSVVFYLFVLLIVMLVGSTLLSAVLLRPLTTLATYLRHLADSIGTTKGGVYAGMPYSLSKRDAGPLGKLDEFGRLIAAVKELAGKLDNRFRLTQAAAAQMAHELRTPLTVVRNSIESAERQLEVARNPQLAKLLAEARSETDHLSEVITNFLDWARMEHGPHEAEGLHAIALPRLLGEIAAKFESMHPGRLRCGAMPDLTIFAKPDLAYQAIRNLLENALKYSPPDLSVSLRVEDRTLYIEDDGPGIPPLVIERIGQPFNVVPQKGNPQWGTGLGLAWVNTICRRYKWELRLLDRNPGTTASISFPE